MKLKTAIIVITLFLNVGLFAQDLIPFAYHGKYGYVNTDLHIIIPPKYDRADNFFDDGYAVVRIFSNKIINQVINKHGDVLISSDAEGLIYHICNNLFSYEKDDDSVVVKLPENKIICNSGAYDGHNKGEGYILATFQNEPRYRYIDHEGNIVLDHLQLTRYSYSFSQQRAVIMDWAVKKEDWKTRIIDMKGNTIGNLDIYRIRQKYSEGLIPAQTTDKKTGYINKDGKFEFKISFICSDYPAATNFKEGYALIQIKENPDLWQIINTKGQSVSKNLSVNSAEEFSNGLSCVSVYNSKQNKYGYINTRGEFIIDTILDSADTFNNGFARIVYNNKEGLLNMQGKIFWSEDIINGHPSEGLINE